MSIDDRKISQLTQGTPADTDWIVYVDIDEPDVNLQTKKALKSELKGDTGNGIASIVLTGTVGLIDTYRITYTDATTFDYTVTNGLDGTDGTNGTDGNGIVSITLISTVGLVDTYRILFTDATTTNYTVTNGLDGTNGTNGTDGADAPEVQFEYSINGTTLWHSTFAVGDFYIRESTDGGTSWSTGMKFIGTDGEGAGDMLKSTYDTDNNGRVDNADYDNTDSGLIADNTNAAIDELQITKADIGSISASLILYKTTALSDVVGYTRIVTSPLDVDYDEPATDVSTGAITTVNQFIGAQISDAGIFEGETGIISVPTIGNIRRTSGIGTASFHFEIYHRTAGGVETLIGTSSNTSNVTSATYTQFFASALIADTVFSSTDRLVFKIYADRVSGGSDPTYDIQFGGMEPVRSPLPVPSTTISHSLLLNRDAVDSHPISAITGLQTGLDGKANLAGGNSFTGNQINTAGSFQVTGGNSFKSVDGVAEFAFNSAFSAGYIGSSTAHSFGILTDGVERIRVMPTTGNVGIGTTAPTEKLVIADGTTTTVSTMLMASKDSNGSSQYMGAITAGYLGGGWADGFIGIDAPTTTPYSTTPVRVLTINSSGNVGIGTTTPVCELDVNGDIKGDTEINTQTGTTYTLVIGDRSSIVERSNASANTVTIPANASVAFPIGTTITVIQYGAGTTTVTGATGVTLNGVSAGSKATAGQYEGIALYKRASDEWVAVNR